MCTHDPRYPQKPELDPTAALVADSCETPVLLRIKFESSGRTVLWSKLLNLYTDLQGNFMAKTVFNMACRLEFSLFDTTYKLFHLNHSVLEHYNSIYTEDNLGDKVAYNSSWSQQTVSVVFKQLRKTRDVLSELCVGQNKL